ncbi:MAG: transporter substrate-binding domain-containing protein [Alteromonadaceae bacterium]|nr:transporter substrate-binding domain-containing protein [Alteromonadaceae bacterium]
MLLYMKNKTTALRFLSVGAFIITLLIASKTSGETLFKAPIKIGIHERFVYREKQLDGSWKGLDVDLMSSISKKAGFIFQLIEFPWKRTLKMVETGDVDIALSAAVTPEREKYALFSRSIYCVGHNVMFIKIADKHRFNDITTLANLEGSQ